MGMWKISFFQARLACASAPYVVALYIHRIALIYTLKLSDNIHMQPKGLVQSKGLDGNCFFTDWGLAKIVLQTHRRAFLLKTTYNW